MIWDSGQFNQSATYWAPPANDGYGGLTWPEPVTLAVRWEDITEKITTTTGDQVVSVARVWPASTVTYKGWFYLGVSTETDPRNQAGAHEIKKTIITPELSGNLVEFIAWL